MPWAEAARATPRSGRSRWTHTPSIGRRATTALLCCAEPGRSISGVILRVAMSKQRDAVVAVSRQRQEPHLRPAGHPPFGASGIEQMFGVPCAIGAPPVHGVRTIAGRRETRAVRRRESTSAPSSSVPAVRQADAVRRDPRSPRPRAAARPGRPDRASRTRFACRRATRAARRRMPAAVPRLCWCRRGRTASARNRPVFAHSRKIRRGARVARSENIRIRIVHPD